MLLPPSGVGPEILIDEKDDDGNLSILSNDIFIAQSFLLTRLPGNLRQY